MVGAAAMQVEADGGGAAMNGTMEDAHETAELVRSHRLRRWEQRRPAVVLITVPRVGRVVGRGSRADTARSAGVVRKRRRLRREVRYALLILAVGLIFTVGARSWRANWSPDLEKRAGSLAGEVENARRPVDLVISAPITLGGRMREDSPRRGARVVLQATLLPDDGSEAPINVTD